MGQDSDTELDGAKYWEGQDSDTELEGTQYWDGGG